MKTFIDLQTSYYASINLPVEARKNIYRMMSQMKDEEKLDVQLPTVDWHDLEIPNCDEAETDDEGSPIE